MLLIICEKLNVAKSIASGGGGGAHGGGGVCF